QIGHLNISIFSFMRSAYFSFGDILFLPFYIKNHKHLLVIRSKGGTAFSYFIRVLKATTNKNSLRGSIERNFTKIKKGRKKLPFYTLHIILSHSSTNPTIIHKGSG